MIQLKSFRTEIAVIVFSFVWGGFILNYLDNYAPWWGICCKDEFLMVLYFAPFVLMLDPLVVLAGGLLASFWQEPLGKRSKSTDN